MPISVYFEPEENSAPISPMAFLSDDDWGLPSQLSELERWLESDGQYLPKGRYVADIGFMPRSDACGGGGILSISSMKILMMIGMELYFSEYRN